MEIKAIRTEADYLIALQEVSALIDLDPAADSPEGERLDVLGTLVQAYEAKHYHGSSRPHRSDQVPHGSIWYDRERSGSVHRTTQSGIRSLGP